MTLDDEDDDPNRVACGGRGSLDALYEEMRRILGEHPSLTPTERSHVLRLIASEEEIKARDDGPEPMPHATADELREAVGGGESFSRQCANCDRRLLTKEGDGDEWICPSCEQAHAKDPDRD